MGFEAGCVPVGTEKHSGWRALAATAVALALATGRSIAWAEEPDDAPPCFDAEVFGNMLRQTPTPIPDCGSDCLVMAWPWVVELDVDQVVRGAAPTGRLLVLSIQHTDYRSNVGGRLWLLRRNSDHGFNLLRTSPEAGLKFCGPGAPAAKPYIGLADHQTLRQLEAESRKAWGRDR